MLRLCLAALLLPAIAFSAEKHVTLLHIADTHAQLETHVEFMPGEKPPYQTMGGYARLKTAIDRERQTAKGACFLADGGDTFQGSGPAAWSEGEVVVEPENALGLDIFVPGNWEPVYGPERFKALMAKLNAKVIAYNFHDVATGERLFAPSVTLDKDGVKITFVGVTDPTTTKRQPPDQVRGLDTTRMDGLRDFVKDLRAKEKPDLVVMVNHTGLTVSRQLAREIPEFDIILSGHTHERTQEPILEGKVIVVEPGSMGSFLGRLDVTIGPQGGVVDHSFRLIPVRASECPEDPVLKDIVTKVLNPYLDRSQKVVAHSDNTLMRYDVVETNADNFISDAVRELTGADVGLSNGFRFAPPIPAGDLTVGDLWKLLPLDARMKIGWVTGRELRSYLEDELELVYSTDAWKLSGGWGPRASGMKFVFTAKNPKGTRLQSVKINDREIEDNDHFTVSGCERAGEPLNVVCRLKGVHDAKLVDATVNQVPSPLTIHEALLEYCRKHGVIDAVRDGRVIASDLPKEAFSQDAIISEIKRAYEEKSNSVKSGKMAHRVAFELTSNSPEAWAGVLNNVENIKKSFENDKMQIEVVAHGKGIDFLKIDNTQFKDRMQALSQSGVVFAACENSMKKNKLTKADLFPFSTTVDSGVGELVRRQESGWSYLKSGD